MFLAVAVAAGALPVRLAYAEEDDEEAAKRAARKHFKKGEKLFALGRFAEALEEYEAAFEAYPAPEFLFNIGQCHRNLEHYDEAIFSFKKYLRLKPDAHNREAVEKLIAELEVARDRERARRRQRVDPIPGRDDPKPAPSRAFYSTWWFWTGVVVVGAAATGFALTRDDGSGLPPSDLGNLDFPR